MFIVNGSNAQGIKTSEFATLEEALAKAHEFLDAKMFNVTILDLEKNTYREAEIDLLLEIVRAEHHRSSKAYGVP